MSGKEPLCCASRGRNPENPSDRTPGNYVEQRLEIRRDGLTNTITTVQKDNYVIQQVGQMYPNSGNPQSGRVYSTEGISPAMDTCQGGNRMPKIAVREATKLGYAEAGVGDFVNIGMPNSQTRRGRVGRQIANTLTTIQEGAVVVDE